MCCLRFVPMLMLLLVAVACGDQTPAVGPVSSAAPPSATTAAAATSERPPPAGEPADDPDTVRRLTRLFGAIVTPAGLVRYGVLRRQPDLRTDIATVLQRYGDAPLPADRDRRLALWCNAYNINVLAFVLQAQQRPEFRSVEKVPGFFDRQPIRVAGERMTLNELENDRIRPLGDARIHAALVCAARSCPPLRAEPYEGARIDAQLDDQCRRWVNDRTKFRLVDGALGLSEILKWYAEDFRRPPFDDPAAFVRRYADPASAVGRALVANPDLPTTWVPYEWTLNQAPNVGSVTQEPEDR